jgi:hypothetical protein
VYTFAASGLEYNGKWINGVKESGKCTVTRVVPDDEKRDAQGNVNPNVLDKITGSYDAKEGCINASYAGESFDVPVPPEVPSFEFVLLM